MTTTEEVGLEAGQPAGDDRPRVGPRRADLLLLGCLLVAHVVVSLLVRPRPRWGDAMIVWGYAETFPDVPLNHHSMRIGTILPAMGLRAVLGPGQVGYYTWPFLMGVLLVVSTYAVAAQLFGRWAGLLAGLMTVFSPVIVFTARNTTAWQLLPDIPSAALFTTGVALLVAGTRLDRAGGARSRATTLLLLAGLSFGWAYLVREFVAFMFACLPVMMLMLRLRWQRWWTVASTMLATFGLELILAWAVHGDPFARLKVAEGHYAQLRQPVSRLTAVLRLPEALDRSPGAVEIVLLGLFALVVAVWTRRRELWLCAAWFLSLWVPLTLMSGFVDTHRISLPAWKVRYWIPLLPPLYIATAGAVVIAVGALWRLDRRALPQRVVRPLALAAVGAVAVSYAWPGVVEAGRSTRDRDWNDVRAFLAAHDGAVDEVLTDRRAIMELGVYRYPPLGGTPEWHARLVQWRVRRPDVVAPTTVFVWSSYAGRRPPSASTGWLPVTDGAIVRLYVRADSGLAHGTP